MLERQLRAAATAGDSATVRQMALSGVDVDARDEDGFTAYNLATMRGHADTAKTILALRDFKYERQALGMTPETYLSRPQTRGELARSVDRGKI